LRLRVEVPKKHGADGARIGEEGGVGGHKVLDYTTHTQQQKDFGEEERKEENRGKRLDEKVYETESTSGRARGEIEIERDREREREGGGEVKWRRTSDDSFVTRTD